MNEREFECEACGTKATLTDQQAFDAGWDYPPFMFPYGVVQPHTCPNCTVDKTAWWALAIEKKQFEELNDHQKNWVTRMSQETQP